MDVQEQQVEDALFGQGQCLPAVVRQPHAVAPAGEQLVHESRAKFVVLGYQDVQRWRRRGWRGGGFAGRRRPDRCRSVARRPTHHSIDRFEQFLLLDRLEQVSIDPQLAKPGWVARPVP